MVNQNWNIDGSKVSAKHGAKVVWEDQRFFSLHFNGTSFHGEVMEERLEDNTLKLKINHRVFDIKKDGALDELISAMGLDKPKVRKLRELSAPMPGRIVNIAVEVGQALDVGDPILSLEAMKMENVLKAEGIGTVKTICINPDQVVEKGVVLIEFE